MRTTTTRALVTATALALVTAAAPVAWGNAAGDRIYGGCFFYGVAGVGVIGDASVTTDPSGAPTSATVTCWLETAGIEQPGSRHAYPGTGVQAGSDIVDAPGAAILCESVSYADGTNEPVTCKIVTTVPAINLYFSCYPCDPPIAMGQAALEAELGA
jgi:hypothetical protein